MQILLRVYNIKLCLRQSGIISIGCIRRVHFYVKMNWKQFTLFMILFGEVIEYSSSSTASRKIQSLLTDSASKNDLSVLQGILNQESLVRFSMVQQIQNVVMDIVDIRKTEALFTENFKTIISEMRALNAENQQQKEEILEMKKGLANCKEGIKQLSKTQEDKSDHLSSLERHFTSFSFSVNETFNTMWKNQSAQDIKLIEIKENLGKLKLLMASDIFLYEFFVINFAIVKR